MLRSADKRLFSGGALLDVFGGRLAGEADGLQAAAGGPLPPVTPTTWYDPSDLSTLTRSNDSVTQMNDKTAGGLNATASSGILLGRQHSKPKRPILQMHTGGMSTGMSGADISSSFFCVACLSQVGGTGRLMFDSTTSGLEFYVGVSGNLIVDKAQQNGLGNTAFTYTAGKPAVFGCAISGTAVTQYLWMIGGSLQSETDTYGAIGFGAVGSPVLFSNWIGWFGESMQFDTTLSSGDATLVATYLATKWGIV